MGWTLKKLAFAALANATMLVASVGVLFSIVKIGLLGTDFVATRVSENESMCGGGRGNVNPPCHFPCINKPISIDIHRLSDTRR